MSAPYRTSTRLADGRELIYFDDVPGLDRSARDPRDLPSFAPDPHLRHDPILDEYVIIAAHRQNRTFQPTAATCPLCPSRGGAMSEIPASDYHVAVFENRFPSLGGPDAPGRCEVVCFTSDHDSGFGDLPAVRLRTLAQAWTDRTVELSRLPGVEYVYIFENRGAEIGATLPHPHGQIYAFPFVPPAVRRALASARRHRERTGGCLFCTIIAAEESTAVRVIAQSESCVAFVPEAARWPYEVFIYPRRHVADLSELDDRERADIMDVYAGVVRRFDRLYDRPTPYVACWQQAPVHTGREAAHLSLRIFTPRRAPDKLKHLAASESGAGVFINDITPEDAARRLALRR